jgi:hypothetical protein
MTQGLLTQHGLKQSGQAIPGDLDSDATEEFDRAKEQDVVNRDATPTNDKGQAERFPQRRERQAQSRAD